MGGEWAGQKKKMEEEDEEKKEEEEVGIFFKKIGGRKCCQLKFHGWRVGLKEPTGVEVVPSAGNFVPVAPMNFLAVDSPVFVACYVSETFPLNRPDAGGNANFPVQHSWWQPWYQRSFWLDSIANWNVDDGHIRVVSHRSHYQIKWNWFSNDSTEVSRYNSICRAQLQWHRIDETDESNQLHQMESALT